MSDDPYADPTPVFVSVTACKVFNPGDSHNTTRVSLHRRSDPCGYIDPDTAVPSFDILVEDAFADRAVSVQACSACGGDI